MASNIVISDAQATPVAHTFVPIGRDKNGTFWFTDQSQSNAIGFWRISVTEKFPGPPKPGDTAESRVYRYDIGLYEPTLEAVTPAGTGYTPAPTVAYTMRGLRTFLCPERSSLLERQNIVKMGPLLDQNAQIVTLVTTLALMQ
jgi:hypothetical protein